MTWSETHGHGARGVDLRAWLVPALLGLASAEAEAGTLALDDELCDLA